ncbi:MAG: endolytic transglycosylase MltG [Caulobacterales bacterium]|nr:endolytic transglycosylase MltG [Caulobacterales bacterium]
MADGRKSPGRSGGALYAFLWTALGLAVLCAGAIVYAYVWAVTEFERPGPSAQETVVELPRGSGLIAIAARLEREGIISDDLLFRAVVTLEGGERDLKAGEYAVPAGASMREVFALLLEGDVIEYQITAAEGLTSAMIVELLRASDLLSGDIDVMPSEGSLLPETYRLSRGADRQELLNRMADAQSEVIDELWRHRSPDLPFDTIEQALILASIVEKETGVASERERVASVFVNRMRRGMRMESDPTIIYGITKGYPLGRGIRRSELDDEDNPYNTYVIRGLPPTPICNPGTAAIAAVLNPAETSDLYFVADGSGGHAFATNYQEHQRNVRQWRQIERARRAAQ